MHPRCGLEVDDLILEQLASSHAVLTDDERELGVCLVDIGAGTTDIAVFTQGAIRHTGVLPIAGDQVTNDIAMALRTPTQHAEEIKIKYACALAQLAGAEDTIKVPSVGDRRRATCAAVARRGGGAALRRTVHAGAGGTAAQRLRGHGRRRVSCSPAAPPRWKAWSNWPRKFSTCRCAWGYPQPCAASTTSCAIRSMPPASACCSTD
jgi:hypothetical protein